MSSHVVISGASGNSPRREIHDLIKDQTQFSLYIQALQALFSDNQSDGVSHFAMSGIHGLPYAEWEGSGDQASKGQFGGYCTHGTVLFPTWHRPYMAVYEQILQKHAEQIAASYTVDQETWRSAAESLRLPYWDWASSEVPPDEVISLQQLNIRLPPDGAVKPVDNPLLGYTFNPIPPQFQSPFTTFKKTIRYPVKTPSGPQGNVDSLKNALSSEYSQTVSSVYNLLAFVNDWDQMSNHTTGSPSGTNSIEGIHDILHGLIGGGGHMSIVPYAAFDPAFYLHHVNVDRVFALWQALHNDVWVSPGSSLAGTHTISANSTLNSTSSLTPFWNDATNYWSSDTIRDWRKLGYDYPEFAGLNLGDPNAVRSAIATKVNELYNDQNAAIGSVKPKTTPPAPPAAPSTPAAGKQQVLVANNPNPAQPPSNVPEKKSEGTAEVKPNVAPANPPANPPNVPEKKDESTGEEKPHVVATNPQPPHPSNVIRQWTARIRSLQHDLHGSFWVFIFFSPKPAPIPQNHSEWRRSPSFVGSHHFFVNNHLESCENCQQMADHRTEGFVHLNNALVKSSGLHTLDPNDVLPFLKANLEWRIVKSDHEEVPVADLKSLVVEVICTPFTHTPGDAFPTPGKMEEYPDVTRGKPGGAS